MISALLQYCNINIPDITFKIKLLYYNRHIREILLQYRLCPYINKKERIFLVKIIEKQKILILTKMSVIYLSVIFMSVGEKNERINK